MSNHPLIEVHRAGAEVFHGTDICKIRTAQLLAELQLPKGLLPLEEIEEMGYNRATGFMWLRQKEATRHVFMVIGNTVSYAQYVTAFVENRQLKQLRGVRRREPRRWITITRIYIDDPDSGRIILKSNSKIRRSFPVYAFEAVEGGDADKMETRSATQAELARLASIRELGENSRMQVRSTSTRSRGQRGEQARSIEDAFLLDLGKLKNEAK